MFDPPHAPAFMVEHLVVDHAANGQLRILLDRIIFQILVPAITIQQVTPPDIAAANFFREGQPHRRALNIQRLVILDHADRLRHIEVFQISFDGFEKQSQTKSFQKVARLRQVRPVTERQRKRLQPRRVHPEFLEHVIRRQKHRSAVDAPGETYPYRFTLRYTTQPLCDLIR